MSSQRKTYSPSPDELLAFAGPPEPVEWLPYYLKAEFGVLNIPWAGESIDRLTKVVLINYEFQSDEEATAELLLFDGRPFLIHEKYGDHPEDLIFITDGAAYKDFGCYLFGLQLKQRMAKLNRKTIDDHQLPIGDLEKQGYIVFSMGDEGLAVHINCPRNQCEFPAMFSKYEAVYQTQRCSFVRWTHSGLSSRECLSDMVDIKIVGGQEISVPGGQIAFILKKADLEPVNNAKMEILSSASEAGMSC